MLNVALGLEHEAIAAYQIGAESKLLKPEVLKVAVAFQGHHKGHRDALAATVKKLGGTPVEAKAIADYAKALNAGALKDQAGVVGLAIKLELGPPTPIWASSRPSKTRPWPRSPAASPPTRPCTGPP
ncbi:ferritin-like domain-containing protein [Oleomonas cavernae]|uniref:ferritin-like domain-containing protein n=1 Tax=Oleomonas cavernae TaxID=2320859 RepID=UPI0023680009|nr:ferritin-like domain-containing protein [Oleomonas cavernae]